MRIENFFSVDSLIDPWSMTHASARGSPRRPLQRESRNGRRETSGGVGGSALAARARGLLLARGLRGGPELLRPVPIQTSSLRTPGLWLAVLRSSFVLQERKQARTLDLVNT